MAQNREPPAFQEYAAAMMAKTDYRLMSLPARGLLYSLRLECWVNHRLPPDAERLARVLGFDQAEVERLIPEVLPFFAVDDGGLLCPELEDYRGHVIAIRERQSQGGKQTAAKHNQRHRQDSSESGAGDLQVTCKSVVQSSSVQSSPAQPNSIQVLMDAPIPDEWVDEYDRATNGF